MALPAARSAAIQIGLREALKPGEPNSQGF
jgi:hypothetical protein